MKRLRSAKSSLASVRVKKVLRDEAGGFIGDPPKPYSSWSEFTTDAYRGLLRRLEKRKK